MTRRRFPQVVQLVRKSAFVLNVTAVPTSQPAIKTVPHQLRALSPTVEAEWRGQFARGCPRHILSPSASRPRHPWRAAVSGGRGRPGESSLPQPQSLAILCVLAICHLSVAPGVVIVAECAWTVLHVGGFNLFLILEPLARRGCACPLPE
ncbi:hypothetical protein RRG08_043119 [Elysia crispata]|uniref:Uncharacterized protein n=1 Tax=Elysia crispata TaxID=231223 RepID=A0AAE0XZN0_9GAST|nr:hypothetical protein RRG08_043119 [Elysia crispata]